MSDANREAIAAEFDSEVPSEATAEEREVLYAAILDKPNLSFVTGARPRPNLKTLGGLVPESQGRIRALTVLYVPSSLDSGGGAWLFHPRLFVVVSQSQFLRDLVNV